MRVFDALTLWALWRGDARGVSPLARRAIFKALIQRGLRMADEGRTVYPWPWPVVEKVYQWLNSYLAHFHKASCYRLVERIWRRFPWLEEYYRRDGERVVYSFSPPRPALGIAQQRAQFRSRLPGHVLAAQMGKWWEVWGGCPENLLPEGRRWFPESRLATAKNVLWESGLPVAWIEETGRRVTRINERILVRRWPGVTDQRPLSRIKPPPPPNSGGSRVIPPRVGGLGGD